MADASHVAPASASPVCKLEDAKAHFSDLVRRARERGLQRVIVGGQDAVVVLSSADYARLAPAVSAQSLAALFGAGPFPRLQPFNAEGAREPLTFGEQPGF